MEEEEVRHPLAASEEEEEEEEVAWGTSERASEREGREDGDVGE